MRLGLVCVLVFSFAIQHPAFAQNQTQTESGWAKAASDTRYVLGPFSAICAGLVSGSVAADIMLRPAADRASAARNYAMLWFLLDFPGNALLLLGYFSTMNLKENLLIDFGPIFQSIGDLSALLVIYRYAGFNLMGQQKLPSVYEVGLLAAMGSALVALSNFGQIKKVWEGELSLWDFAKSDLPLDLGAMLTGIAPWAQAMLNFKALRAHGLVTFHDGIPHPTLYDESLKPSLADIAGNSAAALTILAGQSGSFSLKLAQLPGSVIPAVAEVFNFCFIALPRLLFRLQRGHTYEMLPHGV
jgi:hypothetical protein